jgi:hypothetical protein
MLIKFGYCSLSTEAGAVGLELLTCLFCFAGIQLPLMYKHLFSSKLPKRSGVLLYGPPGTGKVGLIGFIPSLN